MKRYKTVEGVDEHGNPTTFKIELPDNRVILIADTPQWVEKIIRGIKDLEIRKSKPNLDLPRQVLIYCTNNIKEGREHFTFEKLNRLGMVVGMYTVRKVEKIKKRGDAMSWWFETDSLNNVELAARSRLDCPSMAEYLGDKTGYAWFIEDLIVFDEPKPLSAFGVKRAPQSYMFVEVEP